MGFHLDSCLRRTEDAQAATALVRIIETDASGKDVAEEDVAASVVFEKDGAEDVEKDAAEEVGSEKDRSWHLHLTEGDSLEAEACSKDKTMKVDRD